MTSRKSPQQRSIELLRAEGWHVEIVEATFRTPKCVFKRDHLGAFDLACYPTSPTGPGTILLVQVTSGSNHAARRTKIAAEPRVAYARHANCLLELHSWRKNAAGEWVCKREDLS